MKIDIPIEPHLREARRACKLRQHQVAAAIGLTQSFYSQIERGDKRLTIDALSKFPAPMKDPLIDAMIKLLTQAIMDMTSIREGRG